MIDAKDLEILKILQSSARTPNAEVARQVGMAASAVHDRIRKLEERGMIRGYETRLDARPLGLGLVAFIAVRAEEQAGWTATGALLADVPEVQEVHHIAGEDCYLVKVRTSDTEALGRLLRERIGAIPSVRSTRTTIVLTTLKDSATLPLETVDAADGGDHDG
jgi:Lrp/AsnC family transcriptional regulator, leucine-responsive regulatory protein